MSCSLTTDAVLERRKTVTRRHGSWATLRIGTQLCLVRKAMGRKPGEPLDRLAVVTITAVRTEPLEAITADDVAREGFPDWTPAEFVAFYIAHQPGATPLSVVRRIAWVYRDALFGQLFPDDHARWCGADGAQVAG